MKIRASLVLSSALLVTACDADSDSSDTTSRDVVFDGAEIKAALDEDPSMTFFVDVRRGLVNHFDQSEEAIDFSHFLFQCPSMPGPVPMTDILDGFEPEAVSGEYWSIQSMQSEPEDGFRKAPLCPVGCVCDCPLSNPDDCVIICND